MAVSTERKRRRALGEHLTPQAVFREYILPELLPHLYAYRWVDLFAGEGNLIFPLLEHVPPEQRAEFFRDHIFLYDIQPSLVERCVQRAILMGIPEPLARQNIRQQDTLECYPEEILNTSLPVYHVTNPPYLYLGYIVKHPETRAYLRYFQGANSGYQDLYQIALMNDLRHGISHMVYIIPSNFLFGYAVSNQIRDDFLPFYSIRKAIIFEKDLFEHTGTHVAICFFERKRVPCREPQEFEGIKVNTTVHTRRYRLVPRFHYRAGSEFEMFVQEFRAKNPLKVRFYLTAEMVNNHRGDFRVRVIDVNAWEGRSYMRREILVDETLCKTIRANPLFVRTLDTGSEEGRAGLYRISEVYQVDGILVSESPYRTHPIQVFLEPALPEDAIEILKDYFNLMLEYFREQTDSEFLTTYKYSESRYTRKYLGLTQAKALIETFPYLELNPQERARFFELVRLGNAEDVLAYLRARKEGGNLALWL